MKSSPMKKCLLNSVVAAGAVLFLVLGPTTLSFASEDEKRGEWVQKYEELKAQHAKLGAELQTARADYSRGRSSRHLRGAGKVGLIDEIRRLEEEFAQSERDLQNFPEEARRAGALPGWFRDDSPAAPATNERTTQVRQHRAGGSESLSERGAQARQISSEPAEAAASDSSDRQEDSTRSRRSLSDRRAKERESRRLSR